MSPFWYWNTKYRFTCSGQWSSPLFRGQTAELGQRYFVFLMVMTVVCVFGKAVIYRRGWVGLELAVSHFAKHQWPSIQMVYVLEVGLILRYECFIKNTFCHRCLMEDTAGSLCVFCGEVMMTCRFVQNANDENRLQTGLSHLPLQRDKKIPLIDTWQLCISIYMLVHKTFWGGLGGVYASHLQGQHLKPRSRHHVESW